MIALWCLIAAWIGGDWTGAMCVAPEPWRDDPVPVFDAPNEGEPLPVVDRWPGD